MLCGPEEMRRLKDGGLREHGALSPRALQRAESLLAAGAPPPAALTPGALARIRAEIARRGASRPGFAARFAGWRFPRSWRRSVVAAFGMLLLMTVGAAAALWRHHRVESRATSKGARAVSASIFSGRGVSPPVKDPPQVGSTVESDPPPTKTVVPKIAAPKIVLPPPSPALAPPPRASPSTDDTEARLLALALTQVRKQRDPRAALATLDRWERRFPGGVLATEVLSTRIEAAVTMKDLATATRLVESAVVSPGQAGEALRVMRAELRAQSGRCAAALTDFGRLLDDGAVAGIAGELHERALYGRAVCLGRLGQGSAARRDLAAYARHYPHGRFSVEVARLLAQGPPAAAVAP